MNEAMDLTMLLDTDAALRRCALTLHAIGPRDRQWLLANLPQDRRAELERLVGELQSLGIPADPRATMDALGNAHPAGVVAVSKTLALGADAAQLVQCLRHEPPALIAHVIGLRRELCNDILELLGVSKRRQVQELLPTPGHAYAAAPALSQTLLEQLSSRLAEVAPESRPAAGWRSRWRGLARAFS